MKINPRKYPTSRLGILILILIFELLLIAVSNLSEFPIYVSSDVYTTHTEQSRALDEENWLILAQKKVLVSAYNTVPEQTSGDPCIAASGVDICEGMERGLRYAACNFLPFGTKIIIDKVVYEVVDRMASKYSDRIDIVMPADRIQEALEWGVRLVDVQVVVYDI